MSKVNSGIAGAATGFTLGGPVGAAIGGVGGYLLGKDDNSSDIYQQMLDEARSLPLPVLQKFYPELYKQVVALNPEMETGITLGPSAMGNVSVDPKLKQAQMNALLKLQSIGDQGGMTDTDRARLAQIENETNANLRGQQGAIQQNLASRGLSGGMTELVSRNIAAQEAANRQAQQGLDVKAQAEQRALDALMKSGQIGNQMSSQDFAQQQAKAEAADRISAWNAQNLQGLQTRNVNRQNEAQQYNAQTQQGIANANTGVRNQAQQYNLNLPQQNFNNELAKRGITTPAYQGMAQNSYNQARDQDQFIGGLVSAGAKYGASRNKQKNDEYGEY